MSETKAEPTEPKPENLKPWQRCLRAMIESGIAPGTKFEAEWLAERLGKKPTDKWFSIQITEIRKALEERGLYLSGRGLGGRAFIIIQVGDNIGKTKSHFRVATSRLKRGYNLASNTDRALLTKEEAQKMDHLQRIAAARLLLGRGQNRNLLEE